MMKLRLANIWQFFILIFVQVLLLRNLSIYDFAFCYLYIAFVLFLPIQTGVVPQLLLAFVCGFAVDIFYDTLGIHAAATVLLAFLRPYVIRILTPRDGYDATDTVNVFKMGWPWFLTYMLFLIAVHHFALFLLEVASFRMFWFTLIKIILSTLFTFLVIVMVQYLFFASRTARKK